MKMHKILTTLIMLIFGLGCFPQQSIVFEKTYRTVTPDTVIMAHTGAQTSDGGYLLGGYVAYGMYLSQMMFFKIDSVGTYEWKKFYGTMPCSSNMIWDMEPVGDGTYMCCGQGTFSTEGEPGDLKPTNSMVMRVDENANILWYEEFDAGYHEQLSEVAISDTGFLCAGYITNFDKMVDELLWITGDFNGNYVNEHTLNYYDFNSQWLKGVTYLDDGNFVTGGMIWNNAVMIKINSQGDTIKTVTLGTGYPESYGIFDTDKTSGGIVFCGCYSEEQSYGEFSSFHNHCSNNFDNIEEFYFEHENEIKYSCSQKILTNMDNSYIVVGSMRTSTRFEDLWIKKLGVLDQIEWERSIGGTGTEILSDIIKSNDGGFLIIGNSDSFDQYTSMYVVKVDSLGLGNYTSPVVEYKMPIDGYTIYPNPADKYFIIESQNTNSCIEILMFDVSGKIVFQTQTDENQITINTDQLPPGVYIVKSVSEGKVNTDKLIINR